MAAVWCQTIPSFGSSPAASTESSSLSSPLGALSQLLSTTDSQVATMWLAATLDNVQTIIVVSGNIKLSLTSCERVVWGVQLLQVLIRLHYHLLYSKDIA